MVMASGDAQKVWFPEMIAMLRKAADPAMSVDAVLLLRDRLDGTLQRIRSTRQTLPAMMWCPHCQVGHVADLHFTVSHRQPELIAIDKQPNDDVMHLDRARKADRLTS